MTLTRSAPGKVILCGEHSVVYKRPAIATPVSDLRAYASIEPGSQGQGLQLHAVNLKQMLCPRDIDVKDENPLCKAVHLTLEHLQAPEPDAILTLESDLPIAGGMGSGASVTVAIARALSAYLGQELTTEAISSLTYEVEKIHHGTPSGIDNTTVAWEKPVYFIKGQPPEVFDIQEPFDLLIASSGIAASTKEAIAEVHRQWTKAPDFYNTIFDCIGSIARAARSAVESGQLQTLGKLLNENHRLLQKIGVSLPELDHLTQAALEAGAFGAKLTGSGQGGNIIALVTAAQVADVKPALIEAGAAQVWHTQVGKGPGHA